MIRTCRCTVCGRVRIEGEEWFDHPGRLPGETDGLCSTHCIEKEAAGKAASWRGYRRVEAKKARGFGPAKAGTDVFKGMR